MRSVISNTNRREFGLERFVPSSLIDGMKRKELRRLMAHFLKLNSQMTGSSKMLTQLQVSDHILRILNCPTSGFWFNHQHDTAGYSKILMKSRSTRVPTFPNVFLSFTSVILLGGDVLIRLVAGWDVAHECVYITARIASGIYLEGGVCFAIFRIEMCTLLHPGFGGCVV